MLRDAEGLKELLAKGALPRTVSAPEPPRRGPLSFFRRRPSADAHPPTPIRPHAALDDADEETNSESEFGPLTETGDDGFGALHYAALVGDVECAKVLCSAAAEVSPQALSAMLQLSSSQGTAMEISIRSVEVLGERALEIIKVRSWSAHARADVAQAAAAGGGHFTRPAPAAAPRTHCRC
jgi:ankyrin repeat protein